MAAILQPANAWIIGYSLGKFATFEKLNRNSYKKLSLR